MSARAARILIIVIALSLLGMTQIVEAREVQVLSFSFVIPDSWTSEGSGGKKFFATGSGKALEPPLVMAEACVSTTESQCSSVPRPDPAKELANFGCSGAQAEVIERADHIIETRWLCSQFIISGVKTTGGLSLFEVDGAMLFISYLAGETDMAVAIFLDSLAYSLRLRK